MIKIKKPSKKVVIASVIALILLGGGFFYWFQVRPNDIENIGTEEAPINLAPPTEEDAQRVEDNKQRIADQQKDNASSAPAAGSGSKQTVKPNITYAQQYGQSVEVGAEVSVFEDGGTCTATFTSGANTVTKSVQAVKNVNRVNCPAMVADASEFNPKGNWSVTVTYNSNSSSGTSNPLTVVVK
jgi:cytoskeletal protein RodZ